MIGTSDGEQYEDQFQHALAVSEPSYHPPEWRGNKMYGSAFDAADKGIPVRTDIDWSEIDKETPGMTNTPSGQRWGIPQIINPDRVPDISGERGPGQSNKVAANEHRPPIDPMNPSYTDPGGYSHARGTAVPAPMNPGRASPKESIYSAAIQHPDGEIHMGFSHADALLKMPTGKADEVTSLPRDKFEASQGFVTDKGRFVSRNEATDIANESKQIPSFYAETLKRAGLGMFSEDLSVTHPPVESVVGALRHYFKNSDKP